MGFAVFPAKAASPEVDLRLKQIKLDVALVQYEKIETALCELRYRRGRRSLGEDRGCDPAIDANVGAIAIRRSTNFPTLLNA